MAHICNMFRKCRLSRVRVRNGVGMTSNESFFSSLRHQRNLSTISALEISESSSLRKRANNSLCRRHQRKLSTTSTLEISESSALRKRDFSTTQLKTINTSPLKTIVLTGFLGSGKSCLEHRVSNSRSIMPFPLNQGRRRC